MDHCEFLWRRWRVGDEMRWELSGYGLDGVEDPFSAVIGGGFGGAIEESCEDVTSYCAGAAEYQC